MESNSHPEDMDMDLFTGNGTVNYAPPAHLADRLYRKPKACRRSSARSSRRNSLSSRHSHQSHQSALSAHGGPFSTHVAQHLRRASIIESRKARLADRAAHAERVRLRAALVKATPRQSHSEEKALAAQATRERLLAEVAAKCEEEVRRVKKVAEETKEKRAAEHARLRAEMAEKSAEAARRRLAHQQTQRRSRMASLPAVEENAMSKIDLPQLSEELAAEPIQKSWRSQQRDKDILDFKALNLTPDRVKEMTFEDCGALLSEEKVLGAATRALHTWKLLHPSSEGKGERGTVRVFLGIFLILGHPTQTLSYGGQDVQEQDLITKAGELWKALQLALDLGRQEVEAIEAGLLFAFDNFSSAFHAWKTRDSSSLVELMVKQFVELDLILQATKDDVAGGVSEDYAQAIQNNQVQLLARLKKFAGPDTALCMVRTAVKKARKQRAKKTSSMPDNVPRSSSRPEQGVGLSMASGSDHDQTSSTVKSASLKASSFGQAMTLLPSNREISHEIQINGTYQLEQQPWTDARAQFVNGLQAGMRRSMASEGDAAAAGWTYAMAVFIREKIFGLITKNHPLYDRLDGFLDLRLIQQTAQVGMFSYSDFFDTIANLIGQLCSPGRDGAVKEFAADTQSDTITRLFSLIKIIDLMRLDHVNFQFLIASPSIVEQGWQHECELFGQDLAHGVHNLDNLRTWWAGGRSALAATIVNGIIGAIPGDATYARGLTDLVLSNKPLEFDALPETLGLDWRRLLSLRAKVFKMVATSSILLTTKIRLKRNRQESWATEADRLMNLLDLADPTSTNTNTTTADLTAERMVNVLESGRRIPDAVREGLLNFIGRILPATLAASSIAQAAQDAHSHAVQTGKAYEPANPTPTTTVTTSTSDPHSTTVTNTSTDINTSRNTTRPTIALPSPTVDPTFTEQISTFILRSLREHVFTRLSSPNNNNASDRSRSHSNHHTNTASSTTSVTDQLTKMGMAEFVVGVANVVQTLDRIKKVDLRCHGTWYEEVGNGADGR